MESLYDYGARAGFWRLYNLFEKKKIPATVFAVGMALERNPAVAYELHQSKHEVASHGYRWIDYQNVDEETQRAHIKKTIEIHEKLLGKRPAGIYQGKVCRPIWLRYKFYFDSFDVLSYISSVNIYLYINK